MKKNTKGIFYGLDLGVSRGAIARVDLRGAKADITLMPYKLSSNPAHTAHERRGHYINEHFKLFGKHFAPESLTGVTLAIDWSLFESYRGRRDDANTKAFLAGYYTASVKAVGGDAAYVRPSEIRSGLLLKHTAKKDAVWAEAFPVPVFGLAMSAWNPDERDAVILALFAAWQNATKYDNYTFNLKEFCQHYLSN